MVQIIRIIMVCGICTSQRFMRIVLEDCPTSPCVLIVFPYALALNMFKEKKKKKKRPGIVSLASVHRSGL